MKKSKNENIFSLIVIIFVVLLLVWIRNYIIQHTFDKDMYIVKREYTATSDKGTIELYAGECVEVILKKTNHGYKVRTMENGTECYIQDVDLLRKATQRDSIAYNNEKRFREAIRKAINTNQ